MKGELDLGPSRYASTNVAYQNDHIVMYRTCEYRITIVLTLGNPSTGLRLSIFHYSGGSLPGGHLASFMTSWDHLF